MAVEGGPPQWRGLGERGLVHGGPVLHEDLHHVQVASRAGRPQGCRAVDLLFGGNGNDRGRVIDVEDFTRYVQEVLDDV